MTFRESSPYQHFQEYYPLSFYKQYIKYVIYNKNIDGIFIIQEKLEK